MISKTSGKGPWSFDEDNKLLEWVRVNGAQKWSLCSETIPGRSGKQCRERWFNNLNPNVKKGNWTAEEDDMIFQGYLQHGSSWSRIAKNLEGRTENSVKNRFYSTVRKLLSDSEKNGGKGSEQQIRNIIEMSLGKKVGAGIPSHENDQNSENSQQESEEDKSRNEAVSSSKNFQSSENNAHKEGESEEAKKEDATSNPQNLESQANKKQSKQVSQSNNNEMELEEQKPEGKKNSNENQSNENEKQKQNTAEDHNQEGEGQEEDISSHAISSSQQFGMTKRKYNRKRQQDEYSESNLLYRLLKSNDVTIKNTKCLQDYSVFYRKYKQNKYMMKKKKKEDDAKKQSENGDEEHTSSSMDNSNQQDYNEEEDDYDENSHQQLQDLTAAKLQKALKSKLAMKSGFEEKQKSTSSKEQSTKNRVDSENDLDEINKQLMLLKQVKLQQQDKLKKKLKANNQTKVEDLNQFSTKIKNAKNSSKAKKSHHSDQEEDSNLDHLNENSIKEELDEDNYDDNSAQMSGGNDYDEKLFNSNLPSENQLDDVGNLESQLLKFFQKSMGQFFKKFMKQNKTSGKEADKKANSKKELKKYLSQQQQQQQQLLQLQVQEQIQKQLEQLNNQNSKTSKNVSSQQPIQRANTIIQNPPIKNSLKKNGSSQNPLKENMINNDALQNIIQKQIQEMQQVKQEEQQESNDSKLKQNNSKAAGQKQNNISPAPLQVVTKNPINNQKSSFQLNKNQNTPTTRNGQNNQFGSSSSLFSQPNNNNYNLNNNSNNNGGFASLLSSHSLQMQQQNQNNQFNTSSQNLSIQNIKNLLNQNMVGNQNSLNINNGDQGVDQKMLFLLNQLHTLESMLTNTKKELVKLEASLINQRGPEQQQGANLNRSGYIGNNIQGSSNNLYASNGFYNMQGGIPPTANVLKTLPSFGSRGMFEKSDVDAPSFNKHKNSKDNTSQFSDFDKFINNNN